MRQILWGAGLCAGLMLFAAPADAQRLYKGVPTSCPEGTRPVPETDNCVPLSKPKLPKRAVATSCPPGTVPVPETDNCMPAKKPARKPVATSCPAGTVPVPETDNCVPAKQAGSTVCFFNSGPRAGTSFDYAVMGFKPIPIGSPCNDGVASNGTAGGRF